MILAFSPVLEALICLLVVGLSLPLSAQSSGMDALWNL